MILECFRSRDTQFAAPIDPEETNDGIDYLEAVETLLGATAKNRASPSFHRRDGQPHTPYITWRYANLMPGAARVIALTRPGSERYRPSPERKSQ